MTSPKSVIRGGSITSIEGIMGPVKRIIFCCFVNSTNIERILFGHLEKRWIEHFDQGVFVAFGDDLI